LVSRPQIKILPAQQLRFEDISFDSRVAFHSNSSEDKFQAEENEKSSLNFEHVAPRPQGNNLPGQQFHSDNVTLDSQVAFHSNSSEDKFQAGESVKSSLNFDNDPPRPRSNSFPRQQLPSNDISFDSQVAFHSNSFEDKIQAGESEMKSLKSDHVSPRPQSNNLPVQQFHPDDISFDSQLAFGTDYSERKFQASAQCAEQRTKVLVYSRVSHTRNLRQTLEQQGRGAAETCGRSVHSLSMQEVPNVLDVGFLDISAYRGLRAGTIIFSREVTICIHTA